MITRAPGPGLVRCTLTLEAVDVELLDRLARLEGLNRSQEVRGMLAQMRPVIRATVEAFEAALAQREKLEKVAAEAAAGELQAILPDVQRMQGQYLGVLARLEGEAAAAAARDEQDPRASNHGGHTPTPTDNPTTSDAGSAGPASGESDGPAGS